MSAADYCPTCKERTGLTDRGVCAWCDTPLVARKGGWKRPDRKTKFTEQQILALHAAYMRNPKLSINAIAKQVFEKLGYKTPGSAAAALTSEWRKRDLHIRGRIEQTVAVSTTHGQGRRDRDERAYREFLRDTRGWHSLQGPGRPPCKGVKQTPPRKGEPCSRHALIDSEYCAAHDPTRAAARDASLQKMRALRPKPTMVPMAPYQAWLAGQVQELGNFSRVARMLGVHVSLVQAYWAGLAANGKPKTEIGLQTVARHLERAGVRVEDLYPEASGALEQVDGRYAVETPNEGAAR